MRLTLWNNPVWTGHMSSALKRFGKRGEVAFGHPAEPPPTTPGLSSEPVAAGSGRGCCPRCPCLQGPQRVPWLAHVPSLLASGGTCAWDHPGHLVSSPGSSHLCPALRAQADRAWRISVTLRSHSVPPQTQPPLSAPPVTPLPHGSMVSKAPASRLDPARQPPWFPSPLSSAHRAISSFSQGTSGFGLTSVWVPALTLSSCVWHTAGHS